MDMHVLQLQALVGRPAQMENQCGRLYLFILLCFFVFCFSNQTLVCVKLKIQVKPATLGSNLQVLEKKEINMLTLATFDEEINIPN